MLKSYCFTFLFCFSSLCWASKPIQRLQLSGIKNLLILHQNKLLLEDQNSHWKSYNGEKLVPIASSLENLEKSILWIENENYFYLVENKIFSTKDFKNSSLFLELEPRDSVKKFEVHDSKYFCILNHRVIIGDLQTSVQSTFLYDEQKSISDCLKLKDRIICAQENEVYQIKEKAVQLAILPEVILKLDQRDEKDLLILTKKNLWIYLNDLPRKLNPNIGKLPQNIENIFSGPKNIFLIANQEIYTFNWNEAEVNRVGNYIGNFKKALFDQWGSFWFLTDSGLWNHTLTTNFSAPQIKIISVSNDQNQILPLPIELSESNQLIKVNLNFNFLPFYKNKKIEWKLNEGQWIEAKEDIYIPNQKFIPGYNRLLIKAKTDISSTSIPIVLELNKQSPKTSNQYWYWIFGILSSLFALSLFSQFNNNRDKQKLDAEIQKLRSENKALLGEQKIDQLKMNPHFIFNALASVSGLLAQDKTKNARRAIGLISNFLRQFLIQSQGNEITIEEEITLLKNYLEIEKLCREDNFDYLLNCSNEDLLDIKIPNMITQVFAENSIQHGFNQIDRKGVLKINFEEDQGYLVASVEDNGVGIESAPFKSNHKSVALGLVKDRLASLDKNRKKEYVIFESINPGTKVLVRLKKLQ